MVIVAFKRKHCCFLNIFWILCTFYIILNLLPIYKITISSFFSNKKYALCGVFSFFDIIKKNLCEGEVWSPKFCMTKNAATIWDPVHSLTSAASPFPALSLPSGALVLSEEERGLNTAWISHFPSSQWPVHNPLETHQGKLTQKEAVKVEKNQFHLFLGHEKSWDTDIWVDLESSVSISYLEIHSLVPHLLKNHGAHTERKLGKHLWKWVSFT